MDTRVLRIKKLLSVLKPQELYIIDDSASHQGHFGTDEQNIETHMIIKIKANFSELSLLDKHRQINSLLIEEFKKGLHALNIEIL